MIGILRRLTVLAMIVALLFTLFAGALAFVPRSLVCEVTGSCQELPDNDDRLAAYVKVTPGVVPHTVHIRRIGDAANTIRVTFIQVRNGWGRPPLPELELADESFGYVGVQWKWR